MRNNLDRYILQIKKETDLSNKHEYSLLRNHVCIAHGKATHDNIMQMFYEKYPCVIRYVKEIEHL